jgi:hypothetical protein
MDSSQIEKSVKNKLYKTIHTFIDKYVNGYTYGTQNPKYIITKNDYDSFLKQEQKTILDFRRDLKKEKNFTNLIKSINSTGINFFNSELEYKNYVRTLLNEIIEDRVAEYLDKQNQISENRIMTFEKFNLNRKIKK